MRTVCVISATITTWSGVWNSCTLLLYAAGRIGIPVVNRHRSARLRSAHESAGWSRRYEFRAAARLSAVGVSGGMRPFGGSVIRDVCLFPTVVVPRSIQKLL